MSETQKPSDRPSGALSRLRRVWWIVPALWLAQLMLAALLGRAVALTTSASLRGATVIDDGHWIFWIASLLIEAPAVAVTLLLSLGLSAAIGALTWVLLAGGALRQLDAPTRPVDLLTDGLRCAPAVLAQLFWVTLLRALLLLPAALPGGAIASALLVCLTVPAFDLARAELCLDPGPDAPAPPRRRWLGPKPLLAALRRSVKHPATSAAAMALWLVARLTAVAITYLALATAPTSPAALWAIRALALLPLTLGLWRLALAVQTHRK